jgi:hypothetical protein
MSLLIAGAGADPERNSGGYQATRHRPAAARQISMPTLRQRSQSTPDALRQERLCCRIELDYAWVKARKKKKTSIPLNHASNKQ